jgi:STE24 endopeptidase
MSGVALIAYFLVSPALAAAVVVWYAQRAARAAALAPRDAVRRFSRLFAIPWLLYLTNIIAAAAWSGSRPERHEIVRRSPAIAIGLVLLALLPTLVIGRAMRHWARSLGHPGGAVSWSVEMRAWASHAIYMSITFGVAAALAQHVGRGAAAAGAAVLVAVYVVVYPDVYRWIWRATPLREGVMHREVAALIAREGVPVRDVLVMADERGGGMSAYACGLLDRRRYIFVTAQLLHELQPAELLAVVAHEIGHLKHRHVARVGFLTVVSLAAAMGVLTLAVTVAIPNGDSGLRSSLSGLAGALSAMAALIVARRTSRRFEFEADAFSARAMGSPDPMASALRRLASESWLDNDKLDAGALASHPTIRRRLLMLQ